MALLAAPRGQQRWTAALVGHADQGGNRTSRFTGQRLHTAVDAHPARQAAANFDASVSGALAAVGEPGRWAGLYNRGRGPGRQDDIEQATLAVHQGVLRRLRRKAVA